MESNICFGAGGSRPRGGNTGRDTTTRLENDTNFTGQFRVVSCPPVTSSCRVRVAVSCRVRVTGRVRVGEKKNRHGSNTTRTRHVTRIATPKSANASTGIPVPQGLPLTYFRDGRLPIPLGIDVNLSQLEIERCRAQGVEEDKDAGEVEDNATIPSLFIVFTFIIIVCCSGLELVSNPAFRDLETGAWKVRSKRTTGYIQLSKTRE
ncbi:hypothetical protein TIFTF001_003924 [Ficus carica]|uniref:Uncharacterized protein n=1 Tax=Ficus carica TaxID=3494 RepID=A0AA87ZVV4_FICCA|nr:hypothetical protein TIFTF001_003924 [Ficus carica]